MASLSFQTPFSQNFPSLHCNIEKCSRWVSITNLPSIYNTNTLPLPNKTSNFMLRFPSSHQEQKYRKEGFSLDFFSFLRGFDIMISGRCAACKSHRRRCPLDCIFSPYFPANDPQRFACVHRIYGGNNVGKMLQQLPAYAREQAANTTYLEAKCRIQDPVYGCVGIISKLYQQIHDTEIELAKIQTQIALHKLQIPKVEAESDFNVLSTFEAKSNLDVLPAQSSMGQFQ